jgi:5-methylcytosine-specific restriction endonuclease McrA
MNEPWKDFPEIWKSKSKYFTWLRGGLRKVWNNSPQKTTFINKNRKQIPNPNPKGKKSTVWGGTCSMCNKDFPTKDLQVDHVISAGELNDWSDVEGFVRRLLGSGEGELRFVCKPCHKALTYAERYGVNFEQAKAERQAIDFQNQLTPQQQKRKLMDLGASEEEVSNEKSRRNFYVKYLMNGGK